MRVKSSFFVCLIYQSDLCVVDTVNETSSLVSAHSFSNQGDGRRFYTAVKYQNYFMDKCSIFLMILHIFSCCSSVLKRLTMGKKNTVSMSGLCFMQIGK